MNSSMLCPQCGETHDREDMYCVHCAAAVRRECPACGASTPVQGLFCRSCGAVVTEEWLENARRSVFAQAESAGCSSFLALDGGGLRDETMVCPCTTVEAGAAPGFGGRGGMLSFLRNPLVFPVDFDGCSIPELVPALETFLARKRPVLVISRNLANVAQAAEMFLVNREKNVLESLLAEACTDADLHKVSRALGTKVFGAGSLPRPAEDLPGAAIGAVGESKTWILDPVTADGSKPATSCRMMAYLAGGKPIERRKKALFVSLPWK